ncbi:MAG: BspA family leucine-rich repeat surface protein [Oscillospiraceae bacterium]|nr:BspA family leucine-rich repeat surface protein [Oscillospiraceae bacterium]
MKKYFLHVCAALFALMILFPVITTHAADNVYAILYTDGTMVFQHGNTPQSGKTVSKTYEVDLNDTFWALSDIPWYNERQSVRVVSFADTIRPTGTSYWFYGFTNLQRFENLRNLDTSNVEYMNYMFSNCSSLTELDVSSFDTSKVSYMMYTFHSCSSLTTLDLSGWDTSHVTEMHNMFSYSSKLTTLNLSGFSTASAKDTSMMFRVCSALTTLNLSSFDTSHVTDMHNMFERCSNLKTIYVSDKFTTALVAERDQYTGSPGMFMDCRSLVGGNGTKFSNSHTDKEYARIDTPSAPGYFTAYQSQPQPEPEPEPEPETYYIITAYVGDGGTVSPAGDTRVRAGTAQKYVISPNPGYRVQSVRIDGVEMGLLSEYVFQNVIRDHNFAVLFERVPHYAITAVMPSNGALSVTLENSAPVTVALAYFGGTGQFLSVDMKNVSADAGSVSFTLPAVWNLRVLLLDSDCRPLCDPLPVWLGVKTS